MIPDLTPDVAETLLQLAVCALIIYLIGCVVRYFWQTRRIPIRRDAPTDDTPWVTPRPRRGGDDDRAA